MPFTYSTKLLLKVPSSFYIILLSTNRFYFNLKRKENNFFTTLLYKIKYLIEDYYLVNLPNNSNNIELI
jgi:hypothetical protein